jgi:hypothetical protein
MSLRMRLKVLPRQSPSSEILLEISSDADEFGLTSDFFMGASLSGERLGR